MPKNKGPSESDKLRNYPPFESAANEGAALVEKARKFHDAWAKGDNSAITRVCTGLTQPQINRVVMMSQRIAAGQPPLKPTKKEKPDAEE